MQRLSPELVSQINPEKIAEILPQLSAYEKDLVLTAIEEFDRRDKEERIREFEPLHIEDDAHKGFKCNDQWGFLNSPAVERWVFGGNRSGKTEICCVDCVWFLMGIHPYRSIHQKPPVFVRMCGPSWTEGIYDVLHKKMKQLIPRNELIGGSWDKAYSASKDTLTFVNGSVLNFKSSEQEVNKFGGADLDAVYVDEHCSKMIYRENKMRLVDRNGYYVHSMTPELGAITWQRQHVLKAKSKRIIHRFFTTYGNKHLSLAGLEEVEAGLDEKTKQVKLFGKFIPLSGLVYPQFDENIHMLDFKPSEFPEWWPRCFVIDPHIKKEHAMTWAVLDPDEAILYFYRCAKMNGEPKDLKAYIRVRSMNENIVVWIGDKAQGGERIDNFGNQSILKQLSQGENKIPIVGTNLEANESFHAGVEDVRELLNIDMKTNKPNIFFRKGACDGISDEFYEYQFRPETKHDEISFREKVRDVFDDYLDCVRYTVVWAKNRLKGGNGNIKSNLTGKW